MSGETEQEVSGWTVDTLHSHLIRVLNEMDHRYEQRFKAQEVATALRADQMNVEFHEHLVQVKDENRLALNAQEKAVAAAFNASAAAIEKADKANEKRFDSVNEFRGQLNDVINGLMPRTEAVARADANATRIAELAVIMATFVTRDEANALSTRNFERIQELTDRINRTEGRDRGVAQSWGVIVAVVMAVVAIATVVIIITR